MKNSLIRQLSEYGVTVIQSDGKNKVTLPWPPEEAPAEVIPLLRELKASARSWDEEAAIALFEEAVERLRGQYPAGAIPWANENRPELMAAVTAAALKFRLAYQLHDMAECRRAVAEWEKSVMTLFNGKMRAPNAIIPREIISN